MAINKDLASSSGYCIVSCNLISGVKRGKKGSDSKSTSTISTSTVENIVEVLRTQRCRDSTKRTYYTIWKHFNKFFVRLDHKPENWEDRITLLVRFLFQNGLKSATGRRYISAIKSTLLENHIKLDQDQFELNTLMRACKLKNDKFVTCLPISKSLLHLILQEIDKFYTKGSTAQPYLATLYKAMFTVAYFGLLRAGEVAKGCHAILARNVHIGVNKKKILFILQTSKTHGEGAKPQRIKLSSESLKKFKDSNDKRHTYC